MARRAPGGHQGQELLLYLLTWSRCSTTIRWTASDYATTMIKSGTAAVRSSNLLKNGGSRAATTSLPGETRGLQKPSYPQASGVLAEEMAEAAERAGGLSRPAARSAGATRLEPRVRLTSRRRAASRRGCRGCRASRDRRLSA